MGKRLLKFIGMISSTTLKVAFVLYIGILLFKAMKVNIDISNQIAEQKQQIEQIEIKIENIKDLIAYYQTPAFLELEARRELNYVLPDEKVIVLPQSQAEASETTEKNQRITNEKIADQKPNWQLWLEYHLGN